MQGTHKKIEELFFFAERVHTNLIQQTSFYTDLVIPTTFWLSWTTGPLQIWIPANLNPY